MLGQQRLGLRAPQTGLEGRGHRDGVDGEQALHPDQVEADHAGVRRVAAGDQPADHRGAAAERHDGDVVSRCDLEQRLHLVGVGGPDHRVGRIGEVAGAGSEQVGRRLAAGAQAARLVVGVHVLAPDDLGERGEDGVRQAGGRQVEPQVVGHRLVADREDQLDQAACAVGEGGCAGRVAPSGRVHLGRHVLQCDT